MITVKSDTRASVGVTLGRDNTVFLNPYNGEILGGQSPTHNFLRDIVDWHRWLGVEGEGRAAVRALHTGEAFGFAGQTLAGLASLGGCFLAWTGLAMAWRRFRSWRREPEGFITAPILSKLTEGKISMPETSLDSLEPIDGPLAQALSQAQLDLPHSAKHPHEHAYVAHDAALVEWSPASFNSDTLLILYGTVIGNAEMLANKVVAMVRRTGRAAQVRDMAYCQANTLKEATWVLVITSTYGDGEPPEDAAPFWRAVVHGNSLDLCGVKFSVLALGNTTFDHFCKCGRDLDMALQRHGATRFYPRRLRCRL
jgi:flavodoxin